MADIQTYITDKGRDLIAKAVAGGFAINFTGAEIGTGAVGAGDSPAEYTGLKAKYANAMLSDTLYQGDATCRFSAQYSVSGLTETVLITEIGIYANDPDLGRTLFSYTTLGDNPDRLFPSEQASFYKFYDVIISFAAGSGGVTVTIDPSALVPASMVSDVSQVGKLVKVGGGNKMPVDISGSADKFGGQSPSYYSVATHGHDNATQTAAGFMSANDKKAHDTVVSRVNQDLKTTSKPTFAELTVNGEIKNATFA